MPGVIVMKLDANGGKYGPYQHIVVVINARNQQINFQNDAFKGLQMHLHRVQRMSGDPVVRQSTYNARNGTVTVPALTTAVFVNGGGKAMMNIPGN